MIKYSIVEGQAFFSIIVCLLTAYILFLVLAIVLFFFQFTYKPTKEKLIKDLELTRSEIDLINSRDTID